MLMRLLVEIFVIGALLYIGWEKPFRAWVPESMGGPHPTQQSSVRATAPAPYQPFVSSTVAAGVSPARTTAVATNQPPAHPSVTVAGGWMFDSSHRSALDAPRHTATPH